MRIAVRTHIKPLVHIPASPFAQAIILTTLATPIVKEVPTRPVELHGGQEEENLAAEDVVLQAVIG